MPKPKGKAGKAGREEGGMSRDEKRALSLLARGVP